MARIEIYFNLRNSEFSIRHRGRVVDRASCVLIHEPRFVVQEAGRQRVLRERRKNVHAFVTCDPGDYVILPALDYDPFDPVWNKYWGAAARYDPYDSPSFLVYPAGNSDLTQPLHTAKAALLYLNEFGMSRVRVQSPNHQQ